MEEDEEDAEDDNVVGGGGGYRDRDENDSENDASAAAAVLVRTPTTKMPLMVVAVWPLWNKMETMQKQYAAVTEWVQERLCDENA